jgi:hypothetical protein
MNEPIDPDFYQRIHDDIRAILLLPEVRARMKAGGLDPEAKVHNLYLLLRAYEEERSYAEKEYGDTLLALAQIAEHMRTLKHITGALIEQAGQAHPFNPQLKQMHDLLREMFRCMPNYGVT